MLQTHTNILTVSAHKLLLKEKEKWQRGERQGVGGAGTGRGCGLPSQHAGRVWKEGSEHQRGAGCACPTQQWLVGETRRVHGHISFGPALQLPPRGQWPALFMNLPPMTSTMGLENVLCLSWPCSLLFLAPELQVAKDRSPWPA